MAVASRTAIPSDAKALSELAERTFRHTFVEANSAEDMALHCRSAYSEAIQADEISDPDIVTLVSEEDGRLIAFAQLRWGTAPDCVSAKHPGEIHRLYVDNDWHGKGIAQKLMRASIEEIQRRGSDVVWLGVWERNARAQSFYKKCGFAEIGEHIFQVGNDPQRDLVMARAVVA